LKGRMLWFNAEKGHGFIRTEDGERLRLEADGLSPGQALGDRCAGTPVTFDRVESAGDPYAVGVSVVEMTEPRRARRRR
jgi:'Cold-shock' DNA-binding domain